MSSYDVFISHASEDKRGFVQPLATALAAMDVAVWYDEFTLNAGDSLSKSIDRGLADSRFGLVVLSPSFLRKPWPEYELRGLVSKELGRDKVIVPIWLSISRDDVLAFSPPLADRFAIQADSLSLEEIAAEVLRVVRPDRHAQLRRVLLSTQLEGKAVNVQPQRVVAGSVRHSVFPKILLSRINLVRHVFLEMLPGTLEETIEDFRRDTHPEQEICVWEAMASVYLDFKRECKPDAARRNAAFNVLLHLSTGPLPTRPRRRWPLLSASDVKFIRERWNQFGVHLPVGITPLAYDS